MNAHRIYAMLAVAGLVAAGCGDSGRPIADAGPDFSVDVGESPSFDACGSTGSIDTYSWVIVEAPATMAEDTGKPLKLDGTDCRFELPAEMGLNEVGTWVIELTVESGETASTDRLSVEVVAS